MITRAIEFIAKPGKADEMRKCIAEEVIPLLRTNPRFVSMCTFVAPDEPRLVLTLTSWTSQDPQESSWEKLRGVSRLLGPLVDACQRNQVLEGDSWLVPPVRENGDWQLAIGN